MRAPALPRFERRHHAWFRNRRRHTLAWRTFLLLLGLALGWITHGILHP